jgi:fatty-acyl-CoA synthase
MAGMTADPLTSGAAPPTEPTPTTNPSLAHRPGDFATVVEALDYAARGATGLNFYDVRGNLLTALSYRALRERALIAASKLQSLELARGARVVMVADTDPDFAVFFMACQYAGLQPVPVAVPTTIGGQAAYVEQLRRQIEAAEASAAMAPMELMLFLEAAAAGLGLVHVGPPSSFEALPAGAAPLRPFAANEPSYLQFSSGSTRFPKGVRITQACLSANAEATIRYGLEAKSGDRCVSWLPLYHDMGLVGFLLTPMYAQLSVDYLNTRDFARRPLMWLQLLSRNRATLSYAPSFGYDLSMRRANPLPEGLDLSCWRAAGIGGDMIQAHTLEKFAETFAPCGFRREAFVPSYGMAETTVALAFARLGRGFTLDRVDRAALTERHEAVPAAKPDSAREFVRCGVVLPGHAIDVRDDQGASLPDRRVGRIFARGPSLMAGYFADAAESARVLAADGWLDTGDLGYRDAGEIVITGRHKDLIIVNGRNIWPQDIEWALEDSVGPLRAGDTAAFSIESEAGAESIVVLAQCRVADATERDTLITAMQAVIQKAVAVPAAIVLVPPKSLPRTSSGKLSRSKAKQLYLSGGFADAGA